MVAQKKGGSATKRKPSEAQQKKKPQPTKMFAEELADDDDDDDDDFDAMDNAEMDSDDSDNNDTGFKSKSAMKTPNTGSKNQATAKSAKKDVHVSFQIQQKTPTSAQKPPKVRTPTPMVPKKQQAGSLRQEVLKKGMKEFQGMKGPLSTPSDKQATPSAKGKTQNKASEAAKGGDKSGKRKRMMDEESDEDDEDEEEDEFDDDDDLDEDELDDDDLDEEEDDDDDEDEEMDSEEEKALVQKAQAFLDKKGKKGAAELKKGQQQKTPKMAQKPAAESTVVKSKDAAQTPKSNQNQSQQKNQAKKERQSPEVSPAKQKKSPLTAESTNLDMEQRRQRDAKTLFVKGLPPDVTPEELKSLSPDIVSSRIPKPKWHKNNKTGVFAFLEFANEQKAEENFKILQSKKFKGQSLFVDFAGEKSKNKSISSMHVVKLEGKEKNLRKLYISGMSQDTTIDQVAALFPKAFSVAVSKALAEVRSATVSFRNEEDAAEALKANASAKINGKLLTVLYSVEGSKKGKKKRTQSKQATGKRQSGPPTKKMRLETKDDDEGGEDEDDDDDDSDEE